MLEKYCPLSAEFRVNTDDDEPMPVTEEKIAKKLKEISIYPVQVVLTTFQTRC